MWEAYLDVVDRLIQSQVEQLKTHTKQAIWLQTKDGTDWQMDLDDDENDIDDGPLSKYDIDVLFIEDYIIDYISGYVLSAVADWINKRIEKYLAKYCW